MIVKKYIAKDMNDAISQIKLDLGKEAVIVAKRKIRKAGYLGFLSKKVLEVTAAVDTIKGSYEEKKTTEDIYSLQNLMNEEIKKRSEKNIISSKPIINVDLKEVDESNNDINKESEMLKNEVNEMKELLYKFIESNENSNERVEFLKDLELIKELEEYLIKGSKGNLNYIKNKISTLINVSNEKVWGKTVMVGPTGVGKTTTIAKLAGRLSLVEKKTVGLITIDTYRIGAVEQLKTYAEIMNVPFRVVMTLKEMEEALEAMKNCEIILVDTTGRSSKNIMQISEVRAFIDKIDPDNISLVLSSTTKNNDLKSIIEGYKVLGYKDLIITKIDETTSLGTILNASYLSKAPIRYVTNGQNVPDDIKYFSKDEIINLVMGEEILC